MLWAQILLCDALKLRRRGKGNVARVIVRAKKLPLLACFPLSLLREAKGALNGSDIRALCEMFSVVSSGSANRLVGSDVKAL